MDIFTKEKRSEIMSKIRSVSMMEVMAKPLALKIAGCRLIHQPKNMIGKPDYANKTKRVAVYIHGCYWHGCPKHFKMPKTNKKFWKKKIERNKERHAEMKKALRKLGYDVIVIWEHDVRKSY